MSKIRSKNSKAERIVFAYLRKQNIYFQRHYIKAPGKPDICLPRKKKALFIDGDFWHGRTFNKRESSLPFYWVNKINSNVLRDKRQRTELTESGWQVLAVWESDLKRKSTRDDCLDLIKRFLAA